MVFFLEQKKSTPLITFNFHQTKSCALMHSSTVQYYVLLVLCVQYNTVMLSVVSLEIPDCKINYLA